MPEMPVTARTAGSAGAADPAVSRRAPGLDGVRALAVLAVVAFHEGFSATPGGFLGVDVFFVLSGYLITDILAAQFGRDGRLGLRGFWMRRARRLLPALAVVLVTVTAAVAVTEPDQLSGLRPALLGAVSYTSNWWQALHHQSYFDTFGPLPPLQHLWSLAVEEQFYLIWPLILIVVLARIGRPRRRAAVAWAGAAGSALLMLIIYVPRSDPSLVYYGTDTHASALLIGAALALTWPLARVAAAPRHLTRRLDIVGLAGLLILAWAISHFSGADPAVYPAGLILAALAAGGVVIAAAGPGLAGRALAWRPLRWLGVRSYGIYLWHWPVIAISAVLAGRASGTVGVRVIETAIPIALAAGSWRWIEQPILRDGLRVTVRARWQLLRRTIESARRSPAGALPLAIPVAMLAVACTAGYGIVHSPSGPTLQQQIAAGARIGAASQAGHRAAASGRRAGAAVPARPGRTAGARRPAGGGAKGAAGRARRHAGTLVTAVGDSVMLAAAPELHAALPGIYIDATISRQMNTGLNVVRDLARGGRLRPIVVVGLGTNGTVTSAQVRQLLAEVGPARWLVLVNTFVPRPWEHEVDATLAAAARRHLRVLLVNWHAAIEHRTGLLWDDGVHPRPDGGVLYASLVKAVVRSVRRRRRALG
jgi:peptidoglycan/LPS O-acetylase OafA/YrhL